MRFFIRFSQNYKIVTISYLRIYSVMNINTLQRFDATISAITQTQGETMIK